MVFFEWKDEYELGLPDIDLQHTMIVNMLNELHAAIEAGEAGASIERTLDKMLLYVEEHFSTEENAMRDNGYPDIDTHIVEHDVFRGKVLALHERHHQGSGPGSDELVVVLLGWLKNHIAEVDQEFGRFVHEQSELARKTFFNENLSPPHGDNQ
jgi:hemerythrin-like metal-binding protein